jgi:citrate lyase beta subunit
MSSVLDDGFLAARLDELATARAALPVPRGRAGRRQPVHTFYGGAHLFRADTARRLGELAIAALETWAPAPEDLARALGWEDQALAARIHARVRAKLSREPVEDFRIDFEDGYGQRSDAEEDGHAASAAREVAAGLEAGTLPPFVGIRLKSLSPELGRRALATLDRFVSTLVAATGGRLPPGFVVTQPKILSPGEVRVLAKALGELERRLGLPAASIGSELMIETPESVFAPDGRIALPALLAAAGDRLVGVHFGTYDYTAALGVTAAHQRMAHPVCDFAKQVVQVVLAGRGLALSDGATNVLPVPPQRAGSDRALSEAQEAENRRVVHAAWRLHASDVRRSLEQAFYQGWDLHPAQLVSRYATVYAFYLEGVEPAAARLRNFIDQAAQATLVGEVFDDAATGQGLLNYFLRASAAGALDAAEIEAKTGLTTAELATRSFAGILANRRQRRA